MLDLSILKDFTPFVCFFYLALFLFIYLYVILKHSDIYTLSVEQELPISTAEA